MRLAQTPCLINRRIARAPIAPLHLSFFHLDEEHGTAIGSGIRYGFWQPAGVCTLPGSLLNPTTASASADGAKLAIAVAYVANCFTDPISHRLICLHAQDGVQTLTSCP